MRPLLGELHFFLLIDVFFLLQFHLIPMLRIVLFLSIIRKLLFWLIFFIGIIILLFIIVLGFSKSDVLLIESVLHSLDMFNFLFFFLHLLSDSILDMMFSLVDGLPTPDSP